MTQFLRFSLFSFFIFFGVNAFAQSNVTKLEKSTSNLKHVKSKKLILATPTTVVKQEEQQIEYPEKPKKEQKNNLTKVQGELSSTLMKDETTKNRVISNQTTKSPKVQVISPTTIVPNRTRKKYVKQSKSKYQRKEMKIKGVKNE